MTMIAALLLLCIGPLAQDPTPPVPPSVDEVVPDAGTDTVAESGADALETAAPEAREAWFSFLAATRGGGQGAGPEAGGSSETGDPGPGASNEPISAFELQAQVLTRDGVQTNETRIDYRYLAPHFIRFALPSGRETGRGPGKRQSGYWLRDGEEVITLEGREHAEDRKLVDRMAAVAKNFVALSNPSRIELAKLELAEGPPDGLPGPLARRAKRLEWLRVASPSFALGSAAGAGASAGRVYQVDLGLNKRTSLPELAVIRQAPWSSGTPSTAKAPMLIRLENFRAQDGFLVPFALYVHGFAPADRTSRRPMFTDKPAQEIFVTGANLRAQWTEENFRP